MDHTCVVVIVTLKGCNVFFYTFHVMIQVVNLIFYMIKARQLCIYLGQSDILVLFILLLCAILLISAWNITAGFMVMVWLILHTHELLQSPVSFRYSVYNIRVFYCSSTRAVMAWFYRKICCFLPPITLSCRLFSSYDWKSPLPQMSNLATQLCVIWK